MSAYRQSPFANLTPVVKNLLIINLICFLPFILLSENNYNVVVGYGGLFYLGSPLFRVWQILTYMFLHGGWTHILFNMFALFSFGPILEYSIGPKRFFNLYFICGIGAGLFQMLVQAIEVHAIAGTFVPHEAAELSMAAIEKLRDIYSTPIIGASGAIFGLLVAFVMLYPNMELMIMFIPVPVKAKYIVPVYIIIEIYSGLSPTAGDNVAHFAHIGGALLGFIVVKAMRLKGPGDYY